jgi:hypothetical protein
MGICGATSTPLWLMEQVQKGIEEKFSAEVITEWYSS